LVASIDCGCRCRTGWVESRLRVLVAKLEHTNNVKYAVPYPDGITDKSSTEQHNCSFFLGLTFDFTKTEPLPRGEVPSKSVDLNPPVNFFKSHVTEWNIRTKGMEVNVKCLKRYAYLSKHSTLTLTHSLTDARLVQPTRCRTELPSFVFPDGRKRKRTRSVDASGKKRRRTTGDADATASASASDASDASVTAALSSTTGGDGRSDGDGTLETTTTTTTSTTEVTTTTTTDGI
jgi:hypothetical protein